MAEIMAKIMDRISTDPVAWTAETPLPNDGIVNIDADCLRELNATLETLRTNPMPMLALNLDDFDIPACRAMMASVKDTLDNGIGFAILDTLPVETMEKDEAKALYWLMLSMVGQTVGQSWDGKMMFDVTDTGRAYGAGTGVRGAMTANRHRYHTDNSYNLAPEYVSLLCLQTAMEGGISGLASFYSVHNVLLKEYPDLVPRFYEPFPYERHRQHAPDDELVLPKPLFKYDGKSLGVCLGVTRIRAGYEIMGKTMDARTEAALDALDEVLLRPELGKEFIFKTGQIQILNNSRIAHRRTAYTDWPEPERKRHLARIWLRTKGRRFYMG
jgi:hypothetical protein